ncbi:MAG TPA: G1 family glutamic endopeptidase [Candidatus Saccharimonadales bacterium]|nr:G1 family glutamic endopeptidase [Candidatus Saccharimonadales bacterium]
MKSVYRWTSRILVVFTIFFLSSANSVALAASPHSHTAPNIRLRHGTSSNWSGYAAYGSNGNFNSVSATWTQPAVQCNSQSTYSSYWVGLDGYNNSTVEQLGTEGDCSGGNASYYAWYEMYPHPGYYANITVHAGDVFNASVTYRNGGQYTLTLTDVSTGKAFSTTQRMSQAKRASAEVVVEAPWSGGTLPLANFGTAGFTNSLANNQPLGGFSSLDPITMLNPYGMKATPSGFDTTKKNFSISWSAN